MHLARWLRWALGLLGLSFAIFALPSHLEGPVLVPISPGHAIAVVDAVAIVPLLLASGLLLGGLWRARARLLDAVRDRPSSSLGVVFGGGFGLALLLASVFSGFSAWWAVGALLFTASVLVAALHIGRS
jgi:hypothetical protein